jgi:ubiquinone/menaquinone biosynthesis C-methylase UbiE/uncharacterized protein YbaR (Trm112 family)
VTLDAWLLDNLVCPADGAPLLWDGQGLHGTCDHDYPIVDGVPVLLQPNVDQTHHSARESLEYAMLHRDRSPNPSGMTNEALGVHPFVIRSLVATHGLMYRNLTPSEYPIPHLRLPAARGQQWFLDIGCNWGRWSVAAARKGYRVVGIDPSLEAILAARVVARQLGVEASFVVADGRYLPFRSDAFDVAFSFSVLQHLSKDNVRIALQSIRRVLKSNGVSVIQMLNRMGARSLYNQARLAFHEPDPFAVRYWTTHELHATFASALGPSRVLADGFFSANAQVSDLELLPRKYRWVVQSSERLRRIARRVRLFTHLADSVYVTSSEDAARLNEVEKHVTQVA